VRDGKHGALVRSWHVLSDFCAKTMAADPDGLILLHNPKAKAFNPWQ
jgi:hypothetical protein